MKKKLLLISFIAFVLSMVTSANATTVSCELPPSGICTDDTNQCGNPSICGCPTGFVYNASAGKCLFDLTNEDHIKPIATKGEEKNKENNCVQDPPQGAICTRDINVCGNPSLCQCSEGFSWNASMGKCLKVIK